MLKIKKYNSKLKTNWNEFVENSNKNFFFFKRDYLEYKKNINDFSLLYFLDNVLVAILPASHFNHQIISHSGSTYGGIITKKKIKFEILNEIINSTLVYFKKKKFKKIIYKLTPSNFTYNLSAEEEYAISSLKNIKIYNNLNTYIDLNLKINFSKLVKRNINKSLKSDLSISKNNMKNDSIYCIREYANSSNIYDDYGEPKRYNKNSEIDNDIDDYETNKDLFIVDQSKYFKLNENIYCKVSKVNDSGDEKKSYEMEHITIEIYSYKLS